MPNQQSASLPVVTENSVRAGNAKILSACRHSLPEKLICKRTIRCQLATGLLWFIRRTEAIVAEDRLTLSGVALVSVMESSQLRNRADAPAFWLLPYSRLRSVLGQCQMGSGALVVGKIIFQSPAQRSFIPHDDVV